MNENIGTLTALAQLASEYWRLLRSHKSLMANFPPNNRTMSTYRNSERKLNTILEDQGIKIISYEKQEYSPNLAIKVLNNDEFETNEGLEISQMMEPTVMQGERILIMGKAILSKK